VVHLTQSFTEPKLKGAWGPYPSALLDDHWLIEGGQVSGGSILSWLVDAIGKPVFLTRETNLSILAGAICASAGLGYFSGLEQASAEIVRYSETRKPDLEKHRCYIKMLDLYRRATECLTPILHELSS